MRIIGLVLAAFFVDPSSSSSVRKHPSLERARANRLMHVPVYKKAEHSFSLGRAMSMVIDCLPHERAQFQDLFRGSLEGVSDTAGVLELMRSFILCDGKGLVEAHFESDRTLTE